MYNIAIIGAGNIGCRHLQGLVSLEFPVMVDIVDPSPSALEACLSKFEGISRSGNKILVKVHRIIEEIANNIDLAIVATNSDVRAMAIKEILTEKDVSAFLLEKLLFDKEDDYYTISKMLCEKNIPAWVNCNLRATDVFRILKRGIDPQKGLELNIEGKGWEMGCVAIHFIDLFVYITGKKEYEIDKMEVRFFESKRKGFQEISGSIRIRNSIGVLEMNCADSKTVSHTVTIKNGDNKQELSGWSGEITVKSSQDQSSKITHTRIPYISETSGNIAQNIIQKSQCLLPSYSESMNIHVPFVRKITDIYSQRTGLKRCPIT